MFVGVSIDNDSSNTPHITVYTLCTLEGIINLMSYEEQKPIIFLIDDESAILRALSRELNDIDANIHLFDGALDALARVESCSPDVIVSDVRMPEMDGIELMEKISDVLPLSERILLTGYADMEAAINAINRGRVHYYLEKPWDKEHLRRVVDKGIRLSRLRQRNQYLEQLTQDQNAQLQEWNDKLELKVEARTQLLKESYQSTISTFSALVEQRMHEHQSNSRDVADYCVEVGKLLNFSKEELQSLNFAALMRNVGKVGFSDELLSTPYHAMTADQRCEYQQHPSLSAVAVAALKPFKASAPILAKFCENTDGTGYPESLRGSEIPVAASVLAICCDYYDAMAGYICHPPLTRGQARDWLVENSDELYPLSVVDAALAVIDSHEQAADIIDAGEQSLSSHALRDGMRLTRDLISPAGVLLLRKGTELDSQLISHLVHLERNGGLVLQLFIIAP